MTADEKNALLDAAKGLMNTAIALVIAEVFSGLAAAPGLLASAAQMIRATGLEQEAAEAEARAAECPAILLIPWPFIYIGSNAWIAAVARLRDGLPQFVDLEPALRRKEGAARVQEQRATLSQARWTKLSDAQRAVLTDVGINAELLRPLGSGGPQSST
jgi:hypothetical protein